MIFKGVFSSRVPTLLTTYPQFNIILSDIIKHSIEPKHLIVSTTGSFITITVFTIPQSIINIENWCPILTRIKTTFTIVTITNKRLGHIRTRITCITKTAQCIRITFFYFTSVFPDVCTRFLAISNRNTINIITVYSFIARGSYVLGL